MIEHSVARWAVFLDTSAFLAVYVEREEHHDAGTMILRTLVHDRILIITTNFVAAELHALALARYGRHVALSVFTAIRSDPIQTIRVTEADEARGIANIRQIMKTRRSRSPTRSASR